MTTPRISIVLPSFNQGRFIQRTIDSCLMQTCQSVEIRVQDGLSTDETIEVLKSYGDRIQWQSAADSGQGDAVNKAIALSSGEIIAWINSDDFYADESVLERVVAEFDRSPEVDFVYGDSVFTRTDGKAAGRYVPGPDAPSREFVLKHPVSPFPQPSVFFRRQLFLDAGGINTDLHLTLDLELWLRMLPLVRGACYINKVLSVATLHSDAKSVDRVLSQVHEIRRVKLAAMKPDDSPMIRAAIEWAWIRNVAYGAARKAWLRLTTRKSQTT